MPVARRVFVVLEAELHTVIKFPKDNDELLIGVVTLGQDYCSRKALGDWPFRREKNLLKEGVSAKWRRSAIWEMLSSEVRSRNMASVSSIWLM